jgi:branched-chain amino acid transport system ATP-binding protein
MIQVTNLSVRFGGVIALDRVDAELTAPIVGLIGPNGAGKTTFLNALSGFVRPTAGEVKVDGVELLALSPIRRVALGLRRTFQQEVVVDDLTLWDNVRAIADHVAHGDAVDIARAISFVGLARAGHVLGRHANLFERRMVEIAKTLVGRPKLILMDEPGAGLNELETSTLRRLLLDIPSTFDTQLVLIDHDADLIASVCTETLVLDFGKRLALGATRSVLDDPAVRRAYLGAS